MPRKPPSCALCELLDVDATTSPRERLALGVAFGQVVLGRERGLATCTDCHDAIREACADVRRRVRAAESDERDD